MKKKYKNFLIFLILTLWPFVFLFPLTFNIIVMGNDFDLLYFSYKRYIAELIFEGIIPLWSPSEALGIPLIFNPFAQFFYIPGWINFLVYFIKNQLTLSDYLIYTISSLSIYSIGSYLWLRELKIDLWPSLTATLIAICSLKLTETLRFPNAAHAVSWFPWVLYGITLSLNIKKKIKSFLIIFFCYLFILTAGYPYFIVYSVFLFLPYTLFISSSNVRKKLLLNNNFNKRFNSNFYQFNFICGSAFFLSTLISLPWLIKVKSFIDLTTDRMLHNWEFATSQDFYWLDSLGSWLFPPASSSEGWYYFGSISTILIFFFIINFFYEKTKNDREKILITICVIFILFITYFSWVKHSYLFSWSWHNIPLIGQLRAWPRINIILVPVITLLLALSISKFFSSFEYLGLKFNAFSRKYVKKIAKLFFLIGVTIIVIQSFFILFDAVEGYHVSIWQDKRFTYAIATINFFWGNILKLYSGKIYIIFTSISIITLLIIIIFSKNSFFIKNYKFKFSLVILFLASSELFVISNIQWAIPEWKTIENIDSKKPLEELRKSFLLPRLLTTVKGNTYFRNKRRFNVNYPASLGYQSHSNNFLKYFVNSKATPQNWTDAESIKLVKYFYGIDQYARKIFFTKKIYFDKIEDFVNESIEYENQSQFKYKINIEKYNGNELHLIITSNQDGWLSFIDNWDQDWIAQVNNKNVDIKKLFKAYKSIKISSGISNVSFLYRPWKSLSFLY